MSTPRKNTLRAAALVASAAMVVVGVQSGSATAQADRAPARRPSPLTPGSAPPRSRTPQAHAATAAKALGLGAKEKLVVRDVIKDADGTTHTRYERTYAGLPVLGGDLVVHDEERHDARVTKATKATGYRVAVGTTADARRRHRREEALAAAEGGQSKSAEAGTAPRKVVWAANGKPVARLGDRRRGVQHDGTPSELHVVTDAATGKKLFECQAIETGTGTGTVQRHGHRSAPPARARYNLNDTARGGHKTYDLNQRHLRHRHPVHRRRRRLGQRQRVQRQTAGVDAHYGAAATWDFYKNVLRPQRHPQRRRRRLLPRPLRQQLRQRLLGRQLLLHDLRRRQRQHRTR